MFHDGRWAFGQTGAAQSHLERNGVGVGDVFLFFGLFASHEGHDRHHRIFGYLQVDEVRRLGGRPSNTDNPEGFLRRHPHTIGEWNENNTLYLGSGAKARTAHPRLRLTKHNAVMSDTAVGKFASAFRSRRQPLSERAGEQVIAEYERFREHARVASTYDQAMPHPPRVFSTENNVRSSTNCSSGCARRCLQAPEKAVDWDV
jgi:hypothetical protein